MMTALIGVRGGSKRVKNKNSRSFADSNLLKIKVEQLLSCRGIDRVLVNSEDELLLSIAAKAGADTIVRDPAFATDSVSTSDYYKNIAENCDTDYILSATVTTPLVRKESYEEGVRRFYENLESGGVYDSVTSCSQIKEFLYKDGKPMNYDPAHQVRSQDLPVIYALNYGYSIIEKKRMIEYKNIVGKTPLFIKLSRIESVDIDDLEDFVIAETLYKSLESMAAVQD